MPYTSAADGGSLDTIGNNINTNVSGNIDILQMENSIPLVVSAGTLVGLTVNSFSAAVSDVTLKVVLLIILILKQLKTIIVKAAENLKKTQAQSSNLTLNRISFSFFYQFFSSIYSKIINSPLATFITSADEIKGNGDNFFSNNNLNSYSSGYNILLYLFNFTRSNWISIIIVFTAVVYTYKRAKMSVSDSCLYKENSNDADDNVINKITDYTIDSDTKENNENIAINKKDDKNDDKKCNIVVNDEDEDAKKDSNEIENLIENFVEFTPKKMSFCDFSSSSKTKETATDSIFMNETIEFDFFNLDNKKDKLIPDPFVKFDHDEFNELKDNNGNYEIDTENPFFARNELNTDNDNNIGNNNYILEKKIDIFEIKE